MELIRQQSEIITRLNRNITRLQRRLDAQKGSPETRKTAKSTRDLPWIYMITPTYARWTQKADLTRLAQTLMHVPNLHWLLVEDSEQKTELVRKFLWRHRDVLRITHLNTRTEEIRRCGEFELQWNLSNLDTNGAEESVIVSEVSSFQRLIYTWGGKRCPV